MKIKAISVDGFRNLSRVHLQLDTITALVSLNNYGKSNVLIAVDFGIAFIKALPSDRREMMANAGLIPFNKANYGTNYRFEIEAEAVEEDRAFRVVYGYEFRWKSSPKAEPEIVREYLKVRLADKGQKYVQLIQRDPDRAVYRRSETGRCSSRIRVDGAELVINKLNAYDDIFHDDIIRQLNQLQFYIEKSFDTSGNYQPDPIIRKGLENTTLDSKNLPRVLFYLKTESPGRYEMLVDAYRGLFPNIDDLIVKRFEINAEESGQLPEDAPYEISDAIYVLYVRDHNLLRSVNIAGMSDGARRVLLILTKILLAVEEGVSLIALEEPENSVHPRLLQAYLEIIGQFADGCSIVITSHSPYIISCIPTEWIRVGAERKPGIAGFAAPTRSGTNLLQREAAEYHMSVGDYLFSLLSDPESDWDEYLEHGEDE